MMENFYPAFELPSVVMLKKKLKNHRREFSKTFSPFDTLINCLLHLDKRSSSHSLFQFTNTLSLKVDQPLTD